MGGSAGHGPNLGHGWVKYIVIDDNGQECPPVVFPSMIAQAGRAVRGAISRADTYNHDGKTYWAGEDALLGTPSVLLDQERLDDAAFLPVLLKAALAQMGSGGGRCVTGLPGSWAEDVVLCKKLGDRLREATDGYTKISVIPEPVAPLYAELLDNSGEEIGNPALKTGRGLSIDLGQRTDDVCEVWKMRPVKDRISTFDTGMARPLVRIGQLLERKFERSFALYEVDQAVRAGVVRTGGGREQPLPAGWDRPLLENGEETAGLIRRTYGKGNNLDWIRLAGGGAAEERKIAAIVKAYPFAQVVERPQLAIAVGYAKLARRYALRGQ